MSFSIITLLIAVTGVVSLMGFNNYELRRKLLFNPYYTHHNKEYYRFLTSGFVHADFWHLFLNMWALYLFGEAVWQYFTALFGGKALMYFLLLYLGGIVVANLPDFLQKRNNVHFNSLGASGGVASVVFCSVILSPLSKLIIFPIPIPMPAYIFAVLYIAYSVYMEKRQTDNINHLAHLWGAIWGVVFILLAEPASFSHFLQQILGSF